MGLSAVRNSDREQLQVCVFSAIHKPALVFSYHWLFPACKQPHIEHIGSWKPQSHHAFGPARLDRLVAQGRAMA
jgi:hypothetical protein